MVEKCLLCCLVRNFDEGALENSWRAGNNKYKRSSQLSLSSQIKTSKAVPPIALNEKSEVNRSSPRL